MSKTTERKKDVNPFKHIRQKTNDDWFLYWLCEDPDFIKDIDTYNDYCGSSFSKLTYKMTDSDFNKIQEMIDKILEKYGITEAEFDTISTGVHNQGSFDIPFIFIEREDNDDIVIRVAKDIKRNAYIEAWPDVKEWIDGDTIPRKSKVIKQRIRAADDTQLIYAIFKERRNKTKFREIFRLYQEGNLKGYSSKPTNQFLYEDELEKYYHRHKPRR